MPSQINLNLYQTNVFENAVHAILMFEANDIFASIGVKYLFSLPQVFFFFFLHLAHLSATYAVMQKRML